MIASLPHQETNDQMPSDVEALSELIATGTTVFFLATMDDCVPCTLMKPIVRRFSLRLAVDLRVVEPQTAPSFLELHGIERFPELTLFGGGRLVARQIGFHGFDELKTFMSRSLGHDHAIEETAEDVAFRSRIEAAQAAVDTMMAPASEALDPFMEAADAQLRALDARLQAVEQAGEMTAAEARQYRRAEYARIYAPFQDKIDALRDAQARAMQLYEAMTDQALRTFSQPEYGTSLAIDCDPDGSTCRIVNPVRGSMAG